MSYNQDQMRIIEKQKFDSAGFHYDKAYTKLDNILSELGKPDLASHKGMGSNHWVLFTCISNVSTIKNILEILSTEQSLQY